LRLNLVVGGSMRPWESVPATPKQGGRRGMAEGELERGSHPRLRAATAGIQAEAASPALAGCDTLTDFCDTRPIIGPRCVIRCHNRCARSGRAYRDSSARRRPPTRAQAMSGPRYARNRAAGRPAPASRDGVERSRPHVTV
jgi:hypothetical protein